MKLLEPSRIQGRVQAPVSKSHGIRQVFASVRARGESVLHHPGSPCQDLSAALAAASGLGAAVTLEQDLIRIRSRAGTEPGVLPCGESALCLRLGALIAAGFPGPIRLQTCGSLPGRGLGGLDQALEQVQARWFRQGDDLVVQGPAAGGVIKLSGLITSQVASGLLLLLPQLPGPSTLTLENLPSPGYLDLTLDVLASRGLEVGVSPDHLSFSIPGGQQPEGGWFTLEGDWSAAAFYLVAGALAGAVEVSGLSADSTQPDRAVLAALEAAGARVSVRGTRVEVERHRLQAFDFDAAACPDLFPPLAALAAGCSGTSVLRGAGRLRHKESDRALALVEELTRVGVPAHLEGDALVITGAAANHAACSSHGDHRIAMALALVALNSPQGLELDRPETVAKSDPDFFERLDLLRLKQ